MTEGAVGSSKGVEEEIEGEIAIDGADYYMYNELTILQLKYNFSMNRLHIYVLLSSDTFKFCGILSEKIKNSSEFRDYVYWPYFCINPILKTH